MQCGDIWWAELPELTWAVPGYRRPVLLIQSNPFTRSRIATVIVVIITSNLRLATAPGNVLVYASDPGLPKDSVINVSQIVTFDKTMLDEYVGHLAPQTLLQVEEGLRHVLDL